MSETINSLRAVASATTFLLEMPTGTPVSDVNPDRLRSCRDLMRDALNDIDAHLQRQDAAELEATLQRVAELQARLGMGDALGRPGHLVPTQGDPAHLVVPPIQPTKPLRPARLCDECGKQIPWHDNECSKFNPRSETDAGMGVEGADRMPPMTAQEFKNMLADDRASAVARRKQREAL